MYRHRERKRRSPARRAAVALAAGIGTGVVGYAASATEAWLAYGRRKPIDRAEESDDVLDRFLPDPEIAELHETVVDAPAEVTFAAARAMDLHRSPLARTIFGLRTLPARLRGQKMHRAPQGLLDETLALGWRMLEEVPDRMLVVGAVTQPWEDAPVFRGLAPEEFAAFADPGYVKILWTLEVEPLGEDRSRFRTRTRAAATDPAARARFRRYWALVSPGIRLIRRESLRLVAADAEHAHRASVRRRELHEAGSSGATLR